MFVIRLPNGNLQVPQTAVHTGDGRIIGDVYVEIGPDDTDYARLAAQALTPDEVAERRERWRADDAALLREFQEFARLVDDDPFSAGSLPHPGPCPVLPRLLTVPAGPLQRRVPLVRGFTLAAQQGAHLGFTEPSVPARRADAGDPS